MVYEVSIDNLVIFSTIIYYAFLCIVYLLRAYERNKLELMLAPVFSFLLIPFVILLLNLLFIYTTDEFNIFIFAIFNSLLLQE